jgi:hypothetical protein
MPLGQISPQAPQSFGSDARSTHAPLQQAGSSPVQALPLQQIRLRRDVGKATVMHCLPQQISPAEQIVLQAPQFLGSFRRSVQVPPQQSPSLVPKKQR